MIVTVSILAVAIVFAWIYSSNDPLIKYNHNGYFKVINGQPVGFDGEFMFDEHITKIVELENHFVFVHKFGVKIYQKGPDGLKRMSHLSGVSEVKQFGEHLIVLKNDQWYRLEYVDEDLDFGWSITSKVQFVGEHYFISGLNIVTPEKTYRTTEILSYSDRHVNFITSHFTILLLDGKYLRNFVADEDGIRCPDGSVVSPEHILENFEEYRYMI